MTKLWIFSAEMLAFYVLFLPLTLVDDEKRA